MHAAARIEQRLQAVAGEDARHAAAEGLAVLAVLVAEIDQIGLQPGRAQQQKAAQQRVSLPRVGAAGEDRQIAGEAEGPKLALRRGLMEPRSRQRRQQLHRLADLGCAETQQRGGAADHPTAFRLTAFQQALCAAERRLRARAQTQSKAQLRLFSGGEGKLRLRGDVRPGEPAEAAVLVRRERERLRRA